MAKKTSRKCSLCRTAGHTKKTCTMVQEAASFSRTQSPKKPSHVRVHVGEETHTSPHQVHLHRGDSTNVWDTVAVYQEKKEAEHVVQSIDLSQAIVAHNEQQQKKDIDLFREAMKKHVSRSLSAQATAALVEKVLPKREARAPKPIIETSHSLLNVPSSRRRRPFKQDVLLWQSRVRQAFAGRRIAYALMTFVIVAGLPLPAFGYYQKLKETNAYLVQQSTSAFLSLQASTVEAFHANIGQAGTDLNAALSSFAQARNILEKDYHVLLSVAELVPIVGTHVKSRQRLLVAGQHLALGNTYVIKGLENIQDDNAIAFTTKLGILRTHMRSAIPQYQQALEELHGVEMNAIPVEYQQSFADFRLLFSTFVDDMSDLVDLIDAMQLVLGDNGFHRYLVVFQNHHEVRATGGFAGSYAIVDVQKGKIVDIRIPKGGSYDLQGQLSAYVQPPLPLQLANARWEFQDSNWFPDFSKSAEKMAWFYEHARDESVDGVIAINASVLERFLRVLGPVVDEKNDLLIADYDALEKIQTVVEEGPEKEEGAPKAILSRILDQMMHRLGELQQADLVTLLSELHEAAQQKEIQVFMRDQNAQQTFHDFGWTGEIYQTNGQQDYVFVVNTNIQGQKSDARVTQEISHKATVQDDGSVIDSVTIRRTHTGVEGGGQYDANNVDYLRVYVPEGSELLEATGFTYPPEEAFHVPEEWYKQDTDLTTYEQHERFHMASGTRVTDQFGKTTFGNWIMTAPGHTSEVTLVYRLPFSLIEKKVYDSNTEKWKDMFTRDYFTQRSTYQLVVQKQSGVTSEFDSTVEYAPSWVPVWRSDENIDLSVSRAHVHDTLDHDAFWSVIFEGDML